MFHMVPLSCFPFPSALSHKRVVSCFIIAFCRRSFNLSVTASPLRRFRARTGLRPPASASLSLASRWPLPQQLLPVSAAGGGRRRCTLAMFSGRIILNFGISERLRAFRYPHFTRGVVAGDDICSAAFCESAALRKKILPTFSRLNPLRRSRASSPEGRAFCADWQISKAPPSGELDATSGSGLRGFAVPFGRAGKADRL